MKESIPKSTWLVLMLVFLGYIFDAADGTIYALTLPYIKRDLNLTLIQMGLLGSIFLAGSVIGAIAFSYLADNKGRRWGMVASIGTYSLFTGMTGIAQNYISIVIARALTGMGTGGEWPIGAAFLAEVMPAKTRGTAIGIMQSGYPIGYFIAAAVFGLAIAHEWGWRYCYFILIMPAVICFLLRFLIKESDRWIEERAKRDKAKKEGNKDKTVGYNQLLKLEYRKYAIIAASLQFVAGFFAWGQTIWLPMILKTTYKLNGILIAHIMMTAMLVSITGYLFAGYMADKLGRRRTITIYIIGNLISTMSLCLANIGLNSDIWIIYLIVSFMWWFMGFWSILSTYTSELFPTYIRSIGTGFSIGIGRIGATIAPFTLGVIGQYYSLKTGLLVAVLIGCLMVPIVLFGKETAKKELEEIVS